MTRSQFWTRQVTSRRQEKRDARSACPWQFSFELAFNGLHCGFIDSLQHQVQEAFATCSDEARITG